MKEKHYNKIECSECGWYFPFNEKDILVRTISEENCNKILQLEGVICPNCDNLVLLEWEILNKKVL